MLAHVLLALTGLLPSTECASPQALPKGVMAIPVHGIANQTMYGVDFLVGNPPQKLIACVDLGSSLLAFQSAFDQICKQGHCKEFGSYTNRTSTTARLNKGSSAKFMQDRMLGKYVNETIRVDGQMVNNLQIGSIGVHDMSLTSIKQVVSSCGLGLVCSVESGRSCDSPTSFLQQLYDRAYIHKRALSLYFDPDCVHTRSKSTGMLLLGGIDKAKRSGTVHKLRMRDTLDPESLGMLNQVEIQGYRLELAGDKPNTSYLYNDTAYAVWSTRSPRWHFPHDVFEAVVTYFGLDATVIDAGEPRFEVDCKFCAPSDDTIVTVFTDTIELAIPLYRLPIKLGDNRCVLDVGGYDGVLGLPFLRQVYATFNYDDMTIAFALAKHTSDVDIVQI